MILDSNLGLQSQLTDSRRPVELSSAYDVYMKVEDCLACHLSIVDNDPSSLQLMFPHYFASSHHEFAKGLFVLFVSIGQSGKISFVLGNDEDVCIGNRSNISKGQDIIVLVDDLRRNFLSNDFVEYRLLTHLRYVDKYNHNHTVAYIFMTLFLLKTLSNLQKGGFLQEAMLLELPFSLVMLFRVTKEQLNRTLPKSQVNIIFECSSAHIFFFIGLFDVSRSPPETCYFCLFRQLVKRKVKQERMILANKVQSDTQKFFPNNALDYLLHNSIINLQSAGIKIPSTSKIQ